MKQTLISIGVMLTAVLVVSIMMGIGKDSKMKVLVNNAVSIATYQTLKEVMEYQAEPQTSLRKNLEVILQDQKYEITQFVVDTENGALSATVTIQYYNFWYEREVAAHRAVIIE